MLSTAVIVAGGGDIPALVTEELPERRWVLAADSGLDHARRIGLDVDVVVGDFDSVTSASFASFRGTVVRHPADKDSTDLELALLLVAERPNIERVIVLGGHGGRIDHLFANASLLSAARFSHLDIEWLAGTARIAVVHTHATMHGSRGELVSLLPVGGPARGVTTEGLRWALAGETLDEGRTRGVSNVFLGAVATVRLDEGTLLAIQPDAFEGGGS